MKLYSALLIEDAPLAIELARNAVAESCHQLDLTVLEGFEAALDWLSGIVANNEPLPHIILINLKLPKLDGLAVLRTMRSYPIMQNIPILVYSPEQTQADVIMSYQVGANSFVAMPVDQKQYGELFREQLAYWMGYQPRIMPVSTVGDAAGRI